MLLPFSTAVVVGCCRHVLNVMFDASFILPFGYNPACYMWFRSPPDAQYCCHSAWGVVAGHANVQTDIKEATFLGGQDDLVAAGSDDGSVYIYEAATGQVIKILQADEDVANCVQVALLLCVVGQ